MQIFRLSFILACLGLAACEQAQLTGPVGGAEVTVSEFRSGQTVLAGLSTTDEDSLAAIFGQETFDGFNAVQRMAFLGINTFANPNFEASTWYVMSVQGGFDYDADGNGLADQAPGQVFGTVHALVTGAELNSGGFSITPVTEAAFRYATDIADSTSDEALRDALDQVAGDLVGDVTEDGVVDYADVVGWNRLLHGALLRADTDALTAAVTAGDSDDAITALALALFSTPGPAPAPDPEDYFAEFASDVVQSRCGSCHRVGGIGANRSSHILQPTSNRDHIALNTAMYRTLVERRGVDYILDKSIGQRGHGGGNRLGRFPEDFDILETFLNLLDD